jgi:hypothetical protein
VKIFKDVGNVFYKGRDFLFMRWKLFGGLGIILAIFFISMMAAFWIRIDGREYPKQDEVSKLELRIVDWIYDHSERLSRIECREIAHCAMKTGRPELIVAIIEVESVKFTPGSLSRKGAVNWMQVMFDDKDGKDVNGKELIRVGIVKEKRDLWDTDKNIMAGAFILDKFLKKSKGSVYVALKGYSNGEVDAYIYRILSNHADLCLLRE